MNQKDKMARTSIVLAIVAGIVTFIIPVSIPIVVACISITFAFLSMGNDRYMQRKANGAVIISGAIIIINIGILLTTIYLIFFVPEYRQQFDDILQQMYGMNLEEMIGEIRGY